MLYRNEARLVKENSKIRLKRNDAIMVRWTCKGEPEDRIVV